jgi:glycine cleavage system aminomethyltransferase T
VLAPLTPEPLEFGYMTMREIAVGGVPVRALRVTFTGELGWELYCPTEFGAGLWRALWEAGEPHGLAAGGYRAIDTLRLEKGYRVWAADITPDETPHEAGLGFCVRDDKPGARRSRAASRPSACAASCSRTPARSPWATSPCASGARSSGA